MGSMGGRTEMKTGLVMLITVCGVGAVMKETSHFDAEGRIIRTETEDLPETEKCLQYTWFGKVTDMTNVTGSCRDIDTDEGEQKPCFPPLVWTEDDDDGLYGDNEPDESELEDKCSQIGCNPFCIPGPSQKCMKYTEYSGIGNKKNRVTKFCGEVVLWNGKSPNNNKCHRQNSSKEYCYCTGYRCNTGDSYHNTAFITTITILLLSNIIKNILFSKEYCYCTGYRCNTGDS